MARKRMIDPGIWGSEDFAKLSILARLIFIGLFSNADDEGRGRANPAYIKSTVFPYDNVLRLTDIKKSLSEIAAHMSITFYQVNGNEYYCLDNWQVWQKVDKASPSNIPPNDKGLTGDLTNSTNVRRIVSPNRIEQNRKKTLGDFGKPKVAEIENFFESLWQQYPKKEGKGAVKEGQKRRLYAIGYEELSRAIARYKAKIQRDGIERRFVKQGSTFFNSGYVDFLDANYEPVKDSDVLGHAGLPLFEDINDDE